MAFKAGGPKKGPYRPGGPGGKFQPRGPQQRGTPFQPYLKRRRVCYFCVEKKIPDYKDFMALGRYVSDRGRILPRRNTSCCAKHQRLLAKAIKRVRQIALLPYTVT